MTLRTEEVPSVGVVTEQPGEHPPLTEARGDRARQDGALEEALRRQHELFERIFEAVPLMMTIYDPSTNVLRVNPAFERLIGWSSEALSGISLMEQVYPDPEYREQAREYMQACFTVARELRADPALQGVLLIALTGWDQEDARLRSAQAGFDHHLVKPVGAATLVDLLAKYARGGRRARGDA